MIEQFTHKPWALPTLGVINDETGRWYTAGNAKYRSVTSYIQDHWDHRGIDEWRVRVGQDEAEHIIKTSTDRGSSLHAGIEQYLRNGGRPKFDNPHNNMLFIKIRPHLDKINNIRVIEEPLCSVKHEVAGRPDCIADYNMIQSIIDFKTSGKVKSQKYIMTYFLQCGFYGLMAKELYGTDFDHNIKRAVIIMATEDSPTAQIFNESMATCMGMTEQFIKDPDKFQEKWKKIQRKITT